MTSAHNARVREQRIPARFSTKLLRDSEETGQRHVSVTLTLSGNRVDDAANTLGGMSGLLGIDRIDDDTE